MLKNNSITYYHKTINETTKLPEWSATQFKDVWAYKRIGSVAEKGYQNANMIDVRIPIEDVGDLSIFQIGDIIAIGIHDAISKQSDLQGIEFYNVSNVNKNTFGTKPHIHLGGN